MKASIGLVVLLCASSAARADWQYTTWGMSPEQVCAASHGDVSLKQLSKKEARSTERLAMLASGIYTTGKFKFYAQFYFEKRQRKLEKIELLYTGAPDEPPIADLLLALQEKYGHWSAGTIWIDSADNYSITFEIAYGIGFLTYGPLHQREQRGL